MYRSVLGFANGLGWGVALAAWLFWLFCVVGVVVFGAVACVVCWLLVLSGLPVRVELFHIDHGLQVTPGSQSYARLGLGLSLITIS